MFQRSVRNLCPKFVRNEKKCVRKLTVRNKTYEILQVMQAIFVAQLDSFFARSEAVYTGPDKNLHGSTFFYTGRAGIECGCAKFCLLHCSKLISLESVSCLTQATSKKTKSNFISFLPTMLDGKFRFVLICCCEYKEKEKKKKTIAG